MNKVLDPDAWGINEIHQLESHDGGGNYGVYEGGRYVIDEKKVSFVLNNYRRGPMSVQISPDEAEEMGLRLVAAARIVRAKMLDGATMEGSEHG